MHTSLVFEGWVRADYKVLNGMSAEYKYFINYYHWFYKRDNQQAPDLLVVPSCFIGSKIKLLPTESLNMWQILLENGMKTEETFLVVHGNTI